jgi:hypothetical protein
MVFPEVVTWVVVLKLLPHFIATSLPLLKTFFPIGDSVRAAVDPALDSIGAVVDPALDSIAATFAGGALGAVADTVAAILTAITGTVRTIAYLAAAQKRRRRTACRCTAESRAGTC